MGREGRGGKSDSISSLVYEFLKERGKPANWKEITEVIRRKRPDLASKDLGATVRSVLQRKLQFKRVKAGTYYISER